MNEGKARGRKQRTVYHYNFKNQKHSSELFMSLDADIVDDADGVSGRGLQKDVSGFAYFAFSFYSSSTLCSCLHLNSLFVRQT